MAKTIFITGGRRSGKSNYAKNLALRQTDAPVFLATSRIWDEDHKERIEKHRLDRNNKWTTIEEEKYLSRHQFDNQTVVLDCITLWLTNFFYDNHNETDTSYNEAKNELDALSKQDAEFIMVTNEIGMGGHPDNMIQMKFADLQGWVNQYIAEMADEAYLLVSGLPVKLK